MLSIVTATFNQLHLSQLMLESLLRHPPSEPWEMIWVDDGSTDGTRDWLLSLPTPRNKVILNICNKGFAASNNSGVRFACGDIIALLNNDLVLTPGWWTPLYSKLINTAHIGVVGNVQLDYRTHKIDHAGVVFNLVGTGEHYRRGHRSTPTTEGAFFSAVTAACWLIHKENFINAGGFDENYRNGCEDMDLCLRLSKQGLRHWVDFRSVVYHHVGASRGRNPDNPNARRFLNQWGSVTAKLGIEQWPRHYLGKYRHNPVKYNIAKTVDALVRVAGIRKGPSQWAERQRNQILGAV